MGKGWWVLVLFHCYDKTFSCIDEECNTIVVKGIPKKITIREILALQIKIYVRKGWKVFVVHTMDDKEGNNQIN